jgi:hypothetical protein
MRYREPRTGKWKCGLKLRLNIVRVAGAISIVHSATGGAVAQPRWMQTVQQDRVYPQRWLE